MANSSHLSIGEVLGLLHDEFPEVTISKIRFLENQGLIDPERTPSGYRKFYEADIDRLRWILVQQRENFLPLKVIKDRLEDREAAAAVADHVEAMESNGSALGGAGTADADLAPDRPASADVAALAAASAEELQDRPEPIWMVDVARAQAALPPPPPVAQLPLDLGAETESMTAAELATAAGIGQDVIADLVRYGLLEGRSIGGEVFYDADALLIATKAAGFAGRGVEARHLRMYKVAAEREAGFLEQLTLPLLKQRNPQARKEAVELVEELASLGHDLRAAVLRSKLRRHLDQG